MAGIDSHTKLLVRASDATTLGDVTGNHTVTNTGGVSIGAEGTSPFAGKRGFYFNNTNYLTFPNHSDFQPGSGDFTWDFWAKIVEYTTGAHAAEPFISNRSSTAAGVTIIYSRVSAPTVKTFGQVYDSGWKYAIENATFPLNTFRHVVLARNGSNLKLYIGGVLKQTTSISGALQSANIPLYLGKWGTASDTYLKGYLAEVRISTGIDRTTDSTDPLYISSGTSFTPPTSEYSEAADAGKNYILSPLINALSPLGV